MKEEVGREGRRYCEVCKKEEEFLHEDFNYTCSVCGGEVKYQDFRKQ